MFSSNNWSDVVQSISNFTENWPSDAFLHRFWGDCFHRSFAFRWKVSMQITTKVYLISFPNDRHPSKENFNDIAIDRLMHFWSFECNLKHAIEPPHLPRKSFSYFELWELFGNPQQSRGPNSSETDRFQCNRFRSNHNGCSTKYQSAFSKWIGKLFLFIDGFCSTWLWLQEPHWTLGHCHCTNQPLVGPSISVSLLFQSKVLFTFTVWATGRRKAT